MVKTLRQSEVLRLLADKGARICPKAFERLVAGGDFPGPAIELGRIRRWDRSEVEAAISSLRSAELD